MALPALLAPALIGAAGGALLNQDDPLKGALIGGGLGAGGGLLAGSLAAPATGAAQIGAAAPTASSAQGLLSGSIPAAAGETAPLLSQGAFEGALAGNLPAAGGEGAAMLSQGSFASALGDTAAPGVVQEAGFSSLVENQGPSKVSEFAHSLIPGRGFTDKLTAGLLANAGNLLPEQQPQQQAPAGQLNRPAFNPSGNLFLELRRRRS